MQRVEAVATPVGLLRKTVRSRPLQPNSSELSRRTHDLHAPAETISGMHAAFVIGTDLLAATTTGFLRFHIASTEMHCTPGAVHLAESAQR